MLSFLPASRIINEIEAAAAARDFSRRIAARPGGRLGRIVDSLNAILAEAEARDRELRRRLEELTDARDDAQTANRLMRRLKNELKARSAERDAALHRAEAAIEAKSQFLANVTHEIRTPLHGILGLAEVLARAGLEARQHSLVNTIIRSGRGLLTIINDVLDYSKIESGRFDIVARPFSLRVLVEEIASALRPRFERKGLELIVRVEPDLPDLLVGDQGRIRQVLANLVENGLKFTDEGYVMLEVGGSRTEEGAELVVNVQDTGVGIPRDKLEAVFERFTQVAGPATRRHEGTGLGLAICRRLVDRMQGRIRLSSVPGQGTTVTVTLPLGVHEPAHAAAMLPRAEVASPTVVEPRAAAAGANVVSLGGGRFERPRVLLVEDNPVNQAVAQEYLGEMGFLVTLAADGREALARFAAESFDLVLMDCLMPEMDGLETARAMRGIEAQSAGTHTPLVALATNAIARDRERWLAAGMDDFLSKPFGFEELAAVVRKWVAARGLAGSALTGAYT